MSEAEWGQFYAELHDELGMPKPPWWGGSWEGISS